VLSQNNIFCVEVGVAPRGQTANVTCDGLAIKPRLPYSCCDAVVIAPVQLTVLQVTSPADEQTNLVPNPVATEMPLAHDRAPLAVMSCAENGNCGTVTPPDVQVRTVFALDPGLPFGQI